MSDRLTWLRVPSEDELPEAVHELWQPSLEKLGFVATGLTAYHFSCARNGEAPTRLFKLLLASGEEAIAA